MLTGKSARSFGTENNVNIDRDLGVTAGPRKSFIDQERKNLRRNLKTQADFSFILTGTIDAAGNRRTGGIEKGRDQVPIMIGRVRQDPG